MNLRSTISSGGKTLGNHNWLVPIFVALFAVSLTFTAAEAAGNVPPACNDEKVIEAAIETMEDWATENTAIGLVDQHGQDLEKMTTEALHLLNEDTENDAASVAREERVLAKKLGIDKTWVRFCFSPSYNWGAKPGTTTRSKVIVVMHPYNSGEWGLIVSSTFTDVTSGNVGWGWTNYPWPEKP